MIDSVLAVCAGNICRSPMLAGLLHRESLMRGRKVCIGSAGVAARVGNPAAGHACALMSELGIEIGDHRARQLTQGLARDYTLILVMERGHRQCIEKQWPMLRGRVYLLGAKRNTEIMDALGGGAAQFRLSFQQIRDCLMDWDDRLWRA